MARVAHLMLDVGDRIGSYEIEARLGAGGMGSLLLGRRVGPAGFSRLVAIKVLYPHLAQNPRAARMLVNEAKVSARIHHPNVVRVEELGEADGTYFLVMEYVEGCALSRLLLALAERGAAVPLEEAVAIAAHVADGLHAAHETTDEAGRLLEVVHRDVSPQNVMLARAGHVKLIDFGVAKLHSEGTRSATGSLHGKVRYMSPEQAYGRKVDRRADVYALGIVLWEMLTGRQLFDGENDFALLERVRHPHIDPPSRHARSVPPALDAVVLTALAVEPPARPATALEFRRQLLDAVPEALAVDAARLAMLVRTNCPPDGPPRTSVPVSVTLTAEPESDEIETRLMRSRRADEAAPGPDATTTVPAFGAARARRTSRLVAGLAGTAVIAATAGVIVRLASHVRPLAHPTESSLRERADNASDAATGWHGSRAAPVASPLPASAPADVANTAAGPVDAASTVRGPAGAGGTATEPASSAPVPAVVTASPSPAHRAPRRHRRAVRRRNAGVPIVDDEF